MSAPDKAVEAVALALHFCAEDADAFAMARACLDAITAAGWTLAPPGSRVVQEGDLDAATEHLRSINRLLSPGNRTFDELIRDAGLACDLSRSALRALVGEAK